MKALTFSCPLGFKIWLKLVLIWFWCSSSPGIPFPWFWWFLWIWAFGGFWLGSKRGRTSENHSHQVVWADSTRARKSIHSRNFEKTPSFLIDFEIAWDLLGFGCWCSEDIFSTLPGTSLQSFKSIRVDLVEFRTSNRIFLKSARTYQICPVDTSHMSGRQTFDFYAEIWWKPSLRYLVTVVIIS